MGLLDKFLKTSNEIAVNNNEQAYMNVLLCMSASDGDMSDEETLFISVLMRYRKLLKGEKITPYAKSFFKDLRKVKDFKEILTASITRLDSNYYKPLFIDVVDLIFSDGLVEEAEKEMLDSISSLMEIPEEFAKKVIEVTSIKYF